MRRLSCFKPSQTLLKGLLALALCYALMVQSLGGQHDRFIADASGLHTFCLNDTDATDNDTPSDPSHESHVPCCLIFGTGNLPRVSPIIIAFRFAEPLINEPHHEFLNLHEERITTGPAQPRAPPHMG